VSTAATEPDRIVLFKRDEWEDDIDLVTGCAVIIDNVPMNEGFVQDELFSQRPPVSLEEAVALAQEHEIPLVEV
jgi:hypothetical protein